MRIFIENLKTKEFYAGRGKWATAVDEAYAFPNAVAAMNCYLELEHQFPQANFIMRFGTADAKHAIKPPPQMLQMRTVLSVY